MLLKFLGAQCLREENRIHPPENIWPSGGFVAEERYQNSLGGAIVFWMTLFSA